MGPNRTDVEPRMEPSAAVVSSVVSTTWMKSGTSLVSSVFGTKSATRSRCSGLPIETMISLMSFSSPRLTSEEICRRASMILLSGRASANSAGVTSRHSIV